MVKCLTTKYFIKRTLATRKNDLTLCLYLKDEINDVLRVEVYLSEFSKLYHYVSETLKSRDWETKSKSEDPIFEIITTDLGKFTVAGLYTMDDSFATLGLTNNKGEYITFKFKSNDFKRFGYFLSLVKRKIDQKQEELRPYCYYIKIKSGKKCTLERGHGSPFCSSHSKAFENISNQNLLKQAAKTLEKCVKLTKEIKLGPSTDPKVWRKFDNYINALAGRGYSVNQIMESIKSIGTMNGGIFYEILKKIGRDPKWKKFEKIVYAIHNLKAAGAKVKFDEKIIGIRSGRKRQIDISLRFKQGLYDYFLAIECKDKGRKISIDQIEAFCTKIKDIQANKGIMVSPCGFQIGAIETAKSYGIELYTLTSQTSEWEEIVKKEVLNFPFIEHISINHPTPVDFEGFEPRFVRYEDTIIFNTDSLFRSTMSDIIIQICERANNEQLPLPCRINLHFEKGTKLQPDKNVDFDFPINSVDLTLVQYKYQNVQKIEIPPKTLTYTYANISKGDQSIFSPKEIESQIRDKLE